MDPLFRIKWLRTMLDLLWHNHFQSDLKEIPSGQPVKLVFDL